MKDTVVVNLIAEPGVGKSTTMAGVYYKLKAIGVDCEIAPEFAKELVWENSNEAITDNIYLFANQHHKIFRLNGKVDVIITDSPTILTMLYNKKYSDNCPILNDLVLKTFNKYDNLNYLLKRVGKYDSNGRIESEAEAKRMSEELQRILKDEEIHYAELNCDDESVNIIVRDIIDYIN